MWGAARFRGDRRHFLVRAWLMCGSEVADGHGDEEAQQFSVLGLDRRDRDLW